MHSEEENIGAGGVFERNLEYLLLGWAIGQCTGQSIYGDDLYGEIPEWGLTGKAVRFVVEQNRGWGASHLFFFDSCQTSASLQSSTLQEQLCQLVTM